MNKAEADYRQWLIKADHDWLSINNNLCGSEVPWDVVCFHAQQATEKTLKAYLVFHKIRPPHIHDLRALLELASSMDEILSEFLMDAEDLTSLAASSRYPNELYEFQEEDGQVTISIARRICDQVLELLLAQTGIRRD